MKASQVVLGILFLLALFSSSRLGYLVLYIVVAAYVLCYYGAGMGFKRIRVERRLSTPKAYLGQEVSVVVRITNPSRLPVGWVSVQAAHLANFEFADPVAMAELVGSRSVLELTYRMTGITRGCHRLGEIRLAIGDPLGWQPQEAVLTDFGDSLTVYPRITPLTEIPLPRVHPFGSLRAMLRAYEDPTRLGGIRDYRPGDSLRRVHWLASASKGALQVKEFMPTVTAGSIILVNMSEPEYPVGSWSVLGELAIETAASLAVHLIRKDTSVGLATNGGNPEEPGGEGIYLPPANGDGQAENILTLLARLEVRTGVDFAELLAVHGREAAWGSSLYVITPSWSGKMSTLARAFRKAGRTVVPLLLEPKPDLLAAVGEGGQGALTVRRERGVGGVLLGHA